MSDIDQQQNSSYSSSSKKKNKNNQKNTRTITSSSSSSWSSSSYYSHKKEQQEEQEEDMQDIQLAHEHRLKIKVPPRQSSFRVVAIVFYELLHHPTGAAGPTAQTPPPLPLPPQEEEEQQQQQQQQHQKSTTTTSTEDNYQTRPFVVGTNDEPCYIGGSICAERAALVQLRFLPIQKITKVVISTDAHHPVYPGMLCREFMSSHMYIDPCKVPILTAGCVCQRDGCGLCLDKQYYDDVPSSMNDDNDDDDNNKKKKKDRLLVMTRMRMKECVGSNSSSSNSSSKKFHGWEYVKTFLTDLYPYPSPYTRLTALESVKLGMEISKHGHFLNAGHSSSPSSSSSHHNISSGGGIVVSTIEQEKDNDEEEAQELILRAIQVARESNDRSDLHPIQYAAAVKFDNGAIYTASQRKTLEYGCSVDAITQLASSLLLLIPPLTTTTTATGTGTTTGTPSTVHHLLNTNSCTSTTAVVRPRLIVQVDQYGVIHAPFAAARAFLSEYGFGDCRVIIQKDVAPMMSTSSSSSSSTGHESHEEDHDSNMIVQVVTVKDIAPYMPDLGRLHQG